MSHDSETSETADSGAAGETASATQTDTHSAVSAASGDSRVMEAIAFLIPTLFAAILFSPICRFSFVNVDDAKNIFANPYLLPIDHQRLGYFWSHGYYSLYMPLTYMLWGWLARIAPLPAGVAVPSSGTAYVDPAVYHTASLILHVLNTGLAFVLLRRIGVRTVAAAAGALLFAVHPVQIESVAWVTGMNNLTGGLFSLLALIGYVQWGQSEGKAPALRRLYVTLATVAFCLALLAKPTSAAVPFLALALEWGVLRRARSRWLPIIALWLALVAACLTAARIAASYSNQFVLSPLWGRPFLIGDELAWYAARLLFPRVSYVNFGRTIPIVLGHWWGYVTWLVPAAIGLLLWRAGEKARLPRLAALVFVAAVLPTLGLVPFYSQAFSTVADRFLYLAMLGPAILVAWLLTKFDFRPVVALPVMLFILAVAVRTSFQLPIWRDTYSLAISGVTANPNDPVSHTNYGILLASEGRLGNALEQFRLAEALKPNDPEMQYHLGVTLADLGDLKGAIEPLRRATQLDPSLDEAWFRLGIALAKQGDIAEAEGAFRERLRRKPSDGQAHFILGVLLANAHRPEEALPELTEAARLLPTYAEAHTTLGKVLDRLGRRSEALEQYRETLRLNPENKAAKEGIAKGADKATKNPTP